MRRAAVPIASGVASFLLFAAVLPATPGQGDSAEFTLALAFAGVPHPTGYPIYVLLGYPFVHALHALGSGWAAAANAWSAACAALAVALYTALTLEIVSDVAPGLDSRAATALALVPVALVTLDPAWIISATQAEVYSGWYAWLATSLLVAYRWMRTPPPESTPPVGHVAWPGPHARDASPAWSAFAWGLLCGTGLILHALAIVFVIPLTVAIVWVGRHHLGRPVATVTAFVLGLVPPISSIGFIVYRAHHPAAFQWPLEPTWAAVLNHVRGAAYGGYLGRFAPSASEVVLLDRAILPYVIPGLLMGAAWALRASTPGLRVWLLAALGSSALLLAFVVRYGAPDPAAYLVPCLMTCCLAALPIGALAARQIHPRAPFAILAVVAIACGAVGARFAISERARLTRVDARIRAAWRAIPFDRGIVLWADDHYTRLVMFQLLEGSRPGLLVTNPNRLTWAQGRREFVARAGFDPLVGLEMHTMADVAGIPEDIRRRSPLPVIEFRDVLEGARTGPGQR